MSDPDRWRVPGLSKEAFDKLVESLDVSDEDVLGPSMMWRCPLCEETVFTLTCRGCGSYVVVPGGGGGDEEA